MIEDADWRVCVSLISIAVIARLVLVYMRLLSVQFRKDERSALSE